MLIVRAYLRRGIRICEYGKFAVWLGSNRSTLNILVTSKSNIDRGIADSLEELSTGMLVEHPFTESAELLPLVSAVLKLSINTQQHLVR